MRKKFFSSIPEMTEYISNVVKTDEIREVQLKDVCVVDKENRFHSNLGGGELIPLCNIPETMKSFFDRSGQTMEANKRLSIETQIEVMNKYCFPSFNDDAIGKAIIRENEIIALHSNRYAYINQAEAVLMFMRTLGEVGANLDFVSGMYSPSMTELVVKVNHEDLLRDYAISATKAGLPPIVSKGAYVTFEFRTNDVGTCEVCVIPKLNVAGHSIYLDEPFQRKHKDVTSVGAINQLNKGIKSLMVTAREEAKSIGNLMMVNVRDARVCVEKCVKHLNLKKLSVVGVEQFLESANYHNVQNAFQVYVLMHEFLKTEAISNSSKEFKERCNRTLRKLVVADWLKLQ